MVEGEAVRVGVVGVQSRLSIIDAYVRKLIACCKEMGVNVPEVGRHVERSTEFVIRSRDVRGAREFTADSGSA